MKSKLFGEWLGLVERDWDARLERQGNPYTFASMKKRNKKAYVERLHDLSLSYWRRNRFKLWETFYNSNLTPTTKRDYARIILKNNIRYGDSHVRFREISEDERPKLIQQSLILYPTRKKSLLEMLSGLCRRMAHVFRYLRLIV